MKKMMMKKKEKEEIVVASAAADDDEGGLQWKTKPNIQHVAFSIIGHFEASESYVSYECAEKWKWRYINSSNNVN